MTCSRCHQDKPPTDFAGKDCYCRPCRKEYRHDYYLANREGELARNAKYRADHPEDAKRWSRQQYECNRDVVLERSRKRYEDRKELRKAQVRAWVAAHLEEWQAYQRQWWIDHPDLGAAYTAKWRNKDLDHARLIGRNKEARRRAQKRATAIGPVSLTAILLRDGMICHICGGDIPSLAELHFDHVIPLEKFGTHTEANIAPAHRVCNLRKGSRIM